MCRWYGYSSKRRNASWYHAQELPQTADNYLKVRGMDIIVSSEYRAVTFSPRKYLLRWYIAYIPPSFNPAILRVGNQ